MENFAGRLRLVSELFSSRKEFADILGVKSQTAKDYLDGKALPNAEKLASLACKNGIDMHWLLTGEGSMFYSERGGGAELPETESSTADQVGTREKVVDKYVDLYGLEKGLEVARLVLGEVA